MSTTSNIIGIRLCGEGSKNSENQPVIHSFVLHSDISVKEFRDDHFCSFSSNFGDKKFVFLTSQGWQINQDMEHVLQLSKVLTKDNILNFKITSEKPRIGILLHNSQDTAMGFVFCDLNKTVAELEWEFHSQLPELHGCLSQRKFCFVDCNGWPINERQKSKLTVLEISSSHSVTIHVNSPELRPLPHAALDATEGEGAAVVPMKHKARKQLSLMDTIMNLSPQKDSLPLEQKSGNAEQPWLASNYADLKVTEKNMEIFQVLLSYVHTEASVYADLLKTSLESLGYSVFLDIHCIEGGSDWQDVLNNAITNCSLFIPLITMQYGQTLWTNREVKLADVLGKMMIPVNFLQNWPPKCLAIQFATTQYIPGNKTLDGQVTQETFTPEISDAIATELSDRYNKEIMIADQDEEGGLPVPLLSRQNTEVLNDNTPSSAGLRTPNMFSDMLKRRKSALKSYGSNLPKAIPSEYRASLVQSREGKPLIVISSCQKQAEFSQQLVKELESRGYEVWCSREISDKSDQDKSFIFQEKVNEAGAVLFVLSKEFSEDTFCEEQVYYCEQRKRLVPLVYEPFEMPNWMSTLIGTSTFITCTSQNYLSVLLDRVETVLNPVKAEDELKTIIHQKLELANLCGELEEKLPNGKYIYVSGGTQFFSKCGEAISKEIGRQLAKDEDVVLITGGFYGVGETVARSFFEERKRMGTDDGVYHVVAVKDEQDKSSQTRQNADGTFSKVPYGETIFLGNSVRQREMLTPRVVDLCILIEGGPGAAFEAQQFVWNGHQVLPIKVTGGAAGGMFNVPSNIFVRPSSVSEDDWLVLQDDGASAADIGSAVTHIVSAVKEAAVMVHGVRSRSNTESEDMRDIESFTGGIRRSKALIRRNNTASSAIRRKSVKDDSANVRRTYSEKCHTQVKQ